MASIESKLLEAFVAKGTLTPNEVANVVGKAKYVSKYVLYLRLAGHDIVTHKDGRSVTKYVYEGSSVKVTTKAVDRRAGGPGSNKVVKAPKPDKAPKEKPVKAEKPVKEKKAAKPVKEKVDEVEKTFGSTGAVSYNVDADWDAVDLSDFKALR
jgi:hypothetical protein